MQPVTTPRVFSGRYELTHMVARGGMAQVYRARDRLLDRPVALKVLFPELSVDRAFVERFRREAQAAANLSHPNIVPVFDWGEDGGTYFIVMEFVDGQPLSQALRTTGPMAPYRVAQIGTRVADALAYAHRHGVVHRDVKPGNVLLTADGQVKVTDFGIARAINTEESLTQTGAVMGTATYFSPEQAEGHAVDARSDIYSLGVVLYEMVAGRPPFLGETPVAIASKHVRETPPLLRDLSPGVPPALEAVIAKSMAKSPELRYQSASDFQADLQRFLDGRPITAAETSATTTMLAADDTGMVPAVTSTRVTRVVPPVEPPLPPVHDDEEEPPAKRKGSGWLIAIAIIVLLALAGFLVALALGDLGKTHSFALPGVTGEPVATATANLEAKGLTVTTTHHESTTVPATSVISTNPKAGTEVKKGDTVRLTVSSGATPTFPVPTVLTTTVAAAEAKLAAAGFTFTVTTSKSTKPKGTVLAQTPKFGAKAKKHAKVTLTVSTQSTVVTPGVVGETVAAAGSKLGAAGLTSGSTTTACSNTYGKGLVSSQSPAATAKVAPHTAVNLVVSTGGCSGVVPTVKGQSGTTARNTLKNKGFTHVTASTTVTCSPATNGKVVTQTPSGGKTAATTQTVAIGVCAATAPTSTTTSSTTTSTTTTTTPTTTTTTTGGGTGTTTTSHP